MATDGIPYTSGDLTMPTPRRWNKRRFFLPCTIIEKAYIRVNEKP